MGSMSPPPGYSLPPTTPAQPGQRPAVSPPVSRGGCLTLFLVVGLLANIATTLLFLSGSKLLAAFPTSSLRVLTLLAAANVAFLVAVWKWKRWGLFGIAASAAIALLVNLSLGSNPVQAFLGLLGPLILWLLLRPHWHAME